MIGTYNESTSDAVVNNRGDLGRLLPRHDTRAAQTIEWDVQLARRVLHRGKRVGVPGIMHDVSLEGALIEVSEKTDRKVGSHVKIRVLGVDGTATIRHMRDAPTGDGTLYGIRFHGGPMLTQAMTEIVSAFRENNSELRERWESKR